MNHDRAALWTMLGVAIGFKFFGALLILLADQSHEAVTFVVATHWPFLLPFAALLGPGVWWWRLLRARAKRRQLIAAEWREDDLPTTPRLDR
ncbi:MAG: hypothetical protein RMM58_10870 [Chloroflexota bacterium]|nr:hypothetical protein [Dehalococcoidia bacterium]MDW8254368.1 hypothetical protein [Chloroflexota bacterium]